MEQGKVRFRYLGDADRVELATFMPRFPKDKVFERRSDGSFELDLALLHALASNTDCASFMETAPT